MNTSISNQSTVNNNNTTYSSNHSQPDNNHINTNNNKSSQDIITQLTKFGYTINNIESAMDNLKHENNDNDINNIIQYLTNNENKIIDNLNINCELTTNKNTTKLNLDLNEIHYDENQLQQQSQPQTHLDLDVDLKSNPNLNTNMNMNNIQPSLDEYIRSLPTEGYIKLHSSTKYWCISLGDKWQSKSMDIAKLSYAFIKNSSEYHQSINMGKSWASMVNTENPKIQCVTPPSVAGK